MSTSGSITTSNNNGYRNVMFQWSVKSQSIANNTTTITWSIVGAQNGADGWYYAGPFNLTIDGTKVVDNLYPSGSRIQLRAGTTVKTGELTLSHSSDGTKSFSVTLTAAVYDLNTMSVSGTWTLDTIPRQSSATVAGSYAIGSSHTISISRASTSYYHRVSYKYGSSSEIMLSTNATTSVTLNLSSWGSNIPTTSSAAVTIYLRTYPSSSAASSGTNQIGSTASYQTTFEIPSYSQGAPTVTVAEANTANTTGVYVQNISKLKYTVSATANYGATLSYKVSVAGQSMSGSSPLTTPSAISGSGTVSATVTVTDSRGKSASKIVSTSVVAYSGPKITVSKAERSASNASQITCTISCSVPSILNGSTQKNSMTAYAIYDTDTSFPSPSSTYRFSTSGLSASNVTKTYSGLSSTATYYIQFYVKDIFGYTAQVIKVGLGGILHVTKNGIGVLKRREDGALDVNGAIYSSANINAVTTGTTGIAIRVRNSLGDANLHIAEAGNRGIYLNQNSSGVAGHWLIYETPDGKAYVPNLQGVMNASGNQTIDGMKTFTSRAYLYDTTTIYYPGSNPTLYFRNAANSAVENNMGSIVLDTRTVNSKEVTDSFGFREFSHNSSTGVQNGYFENYWLPTVDADRSSNVGYYFLTTKSAVTIAQGGTGATSATGARTNLGVNQPTGSAGQTVAGNSTVTFSVTTANYTFYLFKFYMSGVVTTIFTTRDLLDTNAASYYINDGTSSGAEMLITRTSSSITVKRNGSVSCACRLVYWN